MRVHYAPRTRAYWIEPHLVGAALPGPAGGAWLVVGGHELPHAPELATRIDLVTPEEAARALYVVLHELRPRWPRLIFVVPPPDAARMAGCP